MNYLHSIIYGITNFFLCNWGCRYSGHAYPCECTVRGTYNCKSEEQGRKWTESLKQRGLIEE